MLSAVVVNTFNDQIDASGSSTISLRDALAAAAATSGPQIIDLPAGTYSLALGALQISDASGDLTIQSSGGVATLEGEPISVGASSNVGMIGLEITDAAQTTDQASTSAITNAGTLSLLNVTVTGNDFNNNSDINIYGAGIDNQGQLLITNSTISDNTTFANDVYQVSYDGYGGGIYNAGTATLIDSTISGNEVESLGEAFVLGGGIFNAGALTVQDCTIADNSSYAQTYEQPVTDDYLVGTAEGGGIYNDGASLIISNSIVADNTTTGTTIVTPYGPSSSIAADPDVSGTFDSSGYNLIGQTDGSTGWVSTDLTGTTASPLNPLLGTLTNNGGPTDTILPEAGSPAIGAGSVALIPAGVTTDQRGYARVVDGMVDIGPVESEATAPTAPPSISGVSPNPVAASCTAQTLDISGANFAASGESVTLVDTTTGTTFSDVTIQSATSTQIRISEIFATPGDVWTAQVDNPGGVASNASTFTVVIPGHGSKLSGTIIGSGVSTDGDPYTNVFNGDTSTFFDAHTGNGDWAGLDLGKKKIITTIRFFPRPNFANRMVGGIFQGSNDPTFTHATNLYTIPSTPSAGWNTVSISNLHSFRYVRYLSPNGGYGNVSEVEFYGWPAAAFPWYLWRDDSTPLS